RAGGESDQQADYREQYERHADAEPDRGANSLPELLARLLLAEEELLLHQPVRRIAASGSDGTQTQPIVNGNGHAASASPRGPLPALAPVALYNNRARWSNAGAVAREAAQLSHFQYSPPLAGSACGSRVAPTACRASPATKTEPATTMSPSGGQRATATSSAA